MEAGQQLQQHGQVHAAYTAAIPTSFRHTCHSYHCIPPTAAPSPPPSLPPPHPPSNPSQAREAYERACKLEPDDAQLQVSLTRATTLEAKEVAANKHKFKRRLESEAGAAEGQEPERQRQRQPDKRQPTVRPSAATKERTLLSFGGDEEEEEEGGA